MTQQEKQLLLKDLCARLPYGVRVKQLESIKELELYLTSIYKDTVQVETVTGGIMACSIEAIKPYLRPMSSMTEEELDECVKYSGIRELECPLIETFEDRLLWAIKMFSTDYKSVDWLNAHHFDYRGLIEKGLALEAKEGMYKVE